MTGVQTCALPIYGLSRSNYHPLLLGLLAFEPISFTNSFIWAPPPPFCFLSTSYDSHGLTTSLFGALLGPFAFFGAFLLLYRPVNHYSCHFGPMVFTLLLSFSISFVLLGFFCHWALLPKISINIEQCKFKYYNVMHLPCVIVNNRQITKTKHISPQCVVRFYLFIYFNIKMLLFIIHRKICKIIIP